MAQFTDFSELDLTSTVYGDPFRSYSIKLIPNNIREIFKMAEMLWTRVGTLRTAIQRINRYFITEVEFRGATLEEEKNWRALLNVSLDIPQKMGLVADDYMAYGNSITSINAPFIRFLRCPRCKLELPAKLMDYRFDKTDYIAKCQNPQCSYSGKMERLDRKDPDHTHLNIIRWSVHNLEIEEEPLSGFKRYWWTPPRRVVNGVRANDKFWLDNMPYEVIVAAATGKKLLINSENCYHMRMETLCGIDAGAWGIPFILANFPQIWYLLMLRMFNEAVALDYLVPLRVLTPPAISADPRSGSDPIRHAVNTGNFVERVLSMIEDRRRNPTGWYALPFPVQYGFIGGEGSQMLRPDLIQEATSSLLNDLGIPIEFFQGNLQVQSAPTALRQLEKTWDFLATNLNNWLSWAVSIISTIVGWPEVQAQLSPTSIVDDIVRKQLLLQLASQGMVAMETAMRPWNLDYANEQRRKQEEEEMLASLQQELQRKLERRKSLTGAFVGPEEMAAAGPPPAIGAVGAEGAAQTMPPSIQELHAQAEQLANQLMATPQTQRTSMLRQLKEQNKTLHALVIERLRELERETSSQGGMMLRQQLFGVP